MLTCIPEIDMLQLQERLREQKMLREDRSPTNSPMLKQPRPKDRYTPVELDTGVNSKSTVTELQQAKLNFTADQSADAKKTHPQPLDRRDVKDDKDTRKRKVLPDIPIQQSSMNKPLPQLPPEASSKNSRKNKPLPATPSGQEKTVEGRSHLPAQKQPLHGAKDISTKKDGLTVNSQKNKPSPRPRKPPAVAAKPTGRNSPEQNFPQQNPGRVEDEQPEYMNLAQVSARKDKTARITHDSSQKTQTQPHQNYTPQQQPQEVHYMNIGGMPMKSKNAVSPSYQNLQFSGPKVAPPRDMKRH